MVSNTLKISQEEVVAGLKRLRATHCDDPQYQNLRKDLPSDWPI
jgi:hypothetical protein